MTDNESAPKKVRSAGTSYLVAPTHTGDPVTCFEYDASTKALFVGTAAGAVRMFLIAHLLNSHGTASSADLPSGYRKKVEGRRRSSSVDETEDAKTAPPAADVGVTRRNTVGSADGPEFICMELCDKSDEGIRALYLKDDGGVYAVIGDVSVKHWASAKVKGYKLFKFQRLHNHAICQASFTIAHRNKVVVASDATAETHFVDLDTMKQKPIALPLRSHSVPLTMEENRLVLMEQAGSGARIVRVYDLQQQVVVARLVLSHPGGNYWGFELHGDFMAHVSNNTVIKVHRLRDLEPQTPAERKMPDTDGPDQSRSWPNTKGKHTYKFTTLGDQVLALCFANAGADVISVSADRKLKVWSLLHGKCTRTYTDLKGSFRLGMPLQVHVFGALAFYSADDGVYCLEMDPVSPAS